MQAALRWRRRSLRLVDGLLQTPSVRRIGLVDLLLELLHLLLGLFVLLSLERRVAAVSPAPQPPRVINRERVQQRRRCIMESSGKLVR